MRELFFKYRIKVSKSFISNWFKRRFEFKGSFVMPNLIPIDKFLENNVLCYLEFREFVNMLTDHKKFHFIDKKHIVNLDIYPCKVCVDPETGKSDWIPVSGNFREAHNLLCIISANPEKPHPFTTFWARKMEILCHFVCT